MIAEASIAVPRVLLSHRSLELGEVYTGLTVDNRVRVLNTTHVPCKCSLRTEPQEGLGAKELGLSFHPAQFVLQGDSEVEVTVRVKPNATGAIDLYVALDIQGSIEPVGMQLIASMCDLDVGYEVFTEPEWQQYKGASASEGGSARLGTTGTSRRQAASLASLSSPPRSPATHSASRLSAKTPSRVSSGSARPGVPPSEGGTEYLESEAGDAPQPPETIPEGETEGGEAGDAGPGSPAKPGSPGPFATGDAEAGEPEADSADNGRRASHGMASSSRPGTAVAFAPARYTHAVTAQQHCEVVIDRVSLKKPYRVFICVRNNTGIIAPLRAWLDHFGGSGLHELTSSVPLAFQKPAAELAATAHLGRTAGFRAIKQLSQMMPPMADGRSSRSNPMTRGAGHYMPIKLSAAKDKGQPFSSLAGQTMIQTRTLLTQASDHDTLCSLGFDIQL